MQFRSAAVFLLAASIGLAAAEPRPISGLSLMSRKEKGHDANKDAVDASNITTTVTVTSTVTATDCSATAAGNSTGSLNGTETTGASDSSITSTSSGITGLYGSNSTVVNGTDSTGASDSSGNINGISSNSSDSLDPNIDDGAASLTATTTTSGITTTSIQIIPTRAVDSGAISGQSNGSSGNVASKLVGSLSGDSDTGLSDAIDNIIHEIQGAGGNLRRRVSAKFGRAFQG